MTQPRPIVISAAMIEAGVKALTSASLGQVCFPESLAIDVYIAMEKLRHDAAPATAAPYLQIHGDAIIRSLA